MKIPKDIDELHALKGFDRLEAEIIYRKYVEQLRIEREKQYKAMQNEDYRRKQNGKTD